MSQREAIERIDKFIRDLDNKDIVLIPEKLTARYGFENVGFLGRKKFDTIGTVGDMLSKNLSLYQQGKNTTDNTLRTILIDEALRWINKAYAEGAVKPSDGIFRRYENSLEENKKLNEEKRELESELQQVSTDYVELEAKCQNLKQLLNEEKNSHKNSISLEEYNRVSRELQIAQTKLKNLDVIKK